MDPAQLKKFGFIMLGIAAVALLAYLIPFTTAPTHLYIAGGAAALGVVLTAVGFLKK